MAAARCRSTRTLTTSVARGVPTVPSSPVSTVRGRSSTKLARTGTTSGRGSRSRGGSPPTGGRRSSPSRRARTTRPCGWRRSARPPSPRSASSRAVRCARGSRRSWSPSPTARSIPATGSGSPSGTRARVARARARRPSESAAASGGSSSIHLAPSSTQCSIRRRRSTSWAASSIDSSTARSRWRRWARASTDCPRTSPSAAAKAPSRGFPGCVCVPLASRRGSP